MGVSIRYAFYLACSWLWCIGAFFPLVLWRDYGTPSIIAFTFFNVVGAAGFGYWFVKNSGVKREANGGLDEQPLATALNQTTGSVSDLRQASRFRENQRQAINLFSWVTIAFQFMFVGWLAAVVGISWLLPVMALLSLLFYCQDRFIGNWSVLVFAVSVAMLVWFVGDTEIHLPPVGASQYWPHTVLPLALGFMLSPYFDITFHRAFEQSPQPRLTFLLGFGGLFLSLLVFVFIYAESLAAVFFGGAVAGAVLYPVIGFIVLQTSFTVALHCREYVRFNQSSRSSVLVAIGFIVLLSAVLGGYGKDFNVPFLTISATELIYKSFLYCYGLLFPLLAIVREINQRFWVLLGLSTPPMALGFLAGGALTPLLSVAMLIVAPAIFERCFRRGKRSLSRILGLKYEKTR